MTKISVRGNDCGALVPAVVITSFVILCALLAFGAWTNLYAEYARKVEAAFCTGIELQDEKMEETHEND